MYVVLIFNPTSGISSIVADRVVDRVPPEETERRILSALRTYGIEPEVYHTTPEDTGQGLAARAAAANADIVIAAGGDGTTHAVATGLIGTQSTLGIIATGTMNNLSRSLGIPETIEEACAAIVKGETRLIDVGKINEHVFLEVAGAGLEAALFPAAEEIKSPGLFKTIRGSVAGLITLFTFKPARIRITIDEIRRRPYRAIQVTICNSPFYGAHFQVAPEVLMDDGLLDIVIYRNFSKLEYLRHAISISQGRRNFQPKIRFRRARSLRITADHPLQIQADGVLQGYTPAIVKTLPGALRVRVPGTQVPGLQYVVESSTPVQVTPLES